MPDPTDTKGHMKGRDEYEVLLTSMSSDPKLFHENVLAVDRLRTELLLDIRDFMFTNQQIQIQQTQTLLQLGQALAETLKILMIIGKVAGEHGAERGWLKKIDKEQGDLEGLLRDAGGAVVDLSQFRK